MIGIILIDIIIVIGIYFYIRYSHIIEYKSYIDEADVQIGKQVKNNFEIVNEFNLLIKRYNIQTENTIKNIQTALNLIHLVPENKQELINTDLEVSECLNFIAQELKQDIHIKNENSVKVLIKELEKSNQDMSFLRQYYVQSVLYYNNTITTLSGKILSKVFSFKHKENIEIPEGNE